MVAICLFMLMAAAAFAVDLSGMRHDRAADQKVTDSAAAAGALTNVKKNGEEGCKAALAYVAINTSGISESDLNVAACSQFNASCTSTTAAKEYTQTAGSFTITYVNPVPDDHRLMNTGLLGGGSQPIDSSDGKPCSRVAVEMTSIYNAPFGQVLGMAQNSVTVHTVAAASSGTEEGTPLNLLVLDRFGCNGVRAEGNGGIVVDAILDPDGGGDGVPGLVQGVLAADSDGSSGCTSEGVIHLQGSGSMIRADGPEGCPNQAAPPPFGGTASLHGFTKGMGCGLIQTIAPGTPGCNLPACSRQGGNQDYRPNPFPSSMQRRLTRAPIDHAFNCKANYASIGPDLSWATWALTSANEQDIPPCEKAGTDAPHIDNLIKAVGQNGTPAGFSLWTAAGHSCSLSSGTIDVTGNWLMDCPNLSLSSSAEVRIRGNAVFQGNVTLTSGARLEVRNTAASPGYAFLRNGLLSKAGQSHLGFYDTAVYASRTSRVSLSGGTGSLNWIAPNSGPFKNLALWGDWRTPENTLCSSTPANCYNWAGQAGLVMEGVFFTPLATADYSGTSSQNQTAAQWIADKLVARGGSALVIAPEEGRQILFPLDPGTTLIR